MNDHTSSGWYSNVYSCASRIASLEEEAADLRFRLADRVAEDALIDRVFQGIAPPQWLYDIVESGRACALQSDRSIVSRERENLFDLPSTAPVPMPPDARWYRHSESPLRFDANEFKAARRLLEKCANPLFIYMVIL